MDPGICYPQSCLPVHFLIPGHQFHSREAHQIHHQMIQSKKKLIVMSFSIYYINGFIITSILHQIIMYFNKLAG